MKIGITCYPTYGGSGVVGTELGIELAARGHEVHFIAYQQPIRLNTDHPRILFHEVTVSQYPLFEYPPYDLALATRMAEVAEIYNLDILHVHYAIPHSVSALLARQMLAAADKPRKLPFVTTLHGTDITIVGADHSYLPVTRYAIENSDGVTAISNYLRQRTLKEFEVRNHVEVIYNFVNCDLYKRDPQAAEHRTEFARPDERIVVHVSNFRPVKRLCDVIEIFDRVQKKVPARLLLMGDGPQAHIPVPGLAANIVLYRTKDGVGVRYPGEFRVNGEVRTDRDALPPHAAVSGKEISFALEPAVRWGK